MKAKQYVLVFVYGGLIESADIFTDVNKARKAARFLWNGCKRGTDDVKVLGVGKDKDTIYWMPPKD